jgi:hypothetical protein
MPGDTLPWHELSRLTPDLWAGRRFGAGYRTETIRRSDPLGPRYVEEVKGLRAGRVEKSFEGRSQNVRS